MAKVLVTETYLEDIGDAIRSVNGLETTYKPSEMAAVIDDFYIEPTGTKSITENGTGIDVKDYASADVNVPNTYTASDEGKVVDEGELVAQGSQTITENGTYDTTLISELIANISGGGGSVNILSGTDAPTSDVGSDGAIYLQYFPKMIRSTGSQYVNLNYVYKLDSKIVIDCICHSTSNPYPILFGCQNGASRWVFCYKHNSYGSMYVMGLNYEISCGDNSAIFDKRVIIEAENGELNEYINGTLVKQMSVTAGTVAGDSNYPLWLFQRHGFPAGCYGVVDVFDIKIYESDVLVKHYVPTEQNGVGCLHELFGDTYHYSETQTPLQYGEEGAIEYTYLKADGSWQNLIGSDIDDVDTGGGSGEDDWTKLKTYIESSGTQYINTGYSPTATTKFEVIADVPDNSTNYPCLIGERTATSNEVVIYSEFSGGNLGLVWANGDGVATSDNVRQYYIGNKCKYSLGGDGLRGVLNANGYGYVSAKSVGSFATLPIFIFVLNDNGTPNSVTYCSAKLYRFRIYEGDTLVHEFVPWKDGSDVVCLKDTVTGNLKYNAGTGVFTYGTDA